MTGPGVTARFGAIPTDRSAPRETRAALRFSKINWILLAAGIVSLAAGYWLLAGGSTVAAPLLLVLGYAVLLPLGIIL